MSYLKRNFFQWLMFFFLELFYRLVPITFFFKCSCPKIFGYFFFKGKITIENDTITMSYFSKSTWGEQPVEDIPIFTCKYVGLLVCVSVLYFTATSGHNEWRYRPEIWYTHSPRRIFCNFKKVTWRADSLEKLLCHVDFPYIFPQLPCKNYLQLNVTKGEMFINLNGDHLLFHI